MTTGRMIDYEALSQDAMRGVVRTVLGHTAKSGLPGDHHFYISFDTQAPGVGLSRRLQEKYPEEMTIVLQHRFWDLAVTEDQFEVKLTFDGIPERLVVPFTAIKVFFDPSVRYGLQFEAPDLGPETATASEGQRAAGSEQTVPEAGESAATPLRPTPRPAERKTRPARKPRTDKSAEPTGAALPGPSPKQPVEGKPSGGSSSGAPVVPLTPAPPASGARVVSIDAFRKK
jgi:uncharacterized protein